METNNKCVMLKPSEYEELKKQAESKKPDYINIHVKFDTFSFRNVDVQSSINLSDGLFKQIKRIINTIVRKFYTEAEKHVKWNEKYYKEQLEDAGNKIRDLQRMLKDERIYARKKEREYIANMSKKDRKDYLKPYKNIKKIQF